MTGQETRNKLTDYWKESGVQKPDEFAFLTNVIHQEWTGLSVKKHKSLKGLKSQNLRDHMSEAELIFTALAEPNCRNPTSKGAKTECYCRKDGWKNCQRCTLSFRAKNWKKSYHW